MALKGGRKRGLPTPDSAYPGASEKPACAIPDCGRQAVRHYLCDVHVGFLESRGKLGERITAWVDLARQRDIVRRALLRPLCSVSGCPKRSKTAGLCTAHYREM